MLDNISSVISEEENKAFEAILDEEEIKQAIIKLNSDGSSDPDGLTRIFYEVSLNIIGENCRRMMWDFFISNTLPKSITHTNLVLIPKKNNVQSFSNLRLINLSNFVNKILSTIVHDMLKNLLPRLISLINQVLLKEGVL